MTTVDTRPPIDAPGVYDLPADVYHADPVVGGSLSSTGARRLLPPSCPAKFAYNRANPKPPTREFNLGHAAHRVVLGAGADLVDIEFDNYRKTAAQEARDAAWDAGHIPLLPKERDQVQAMHAALLAHRYGAALFTGGVAEQTLVWRDDATGVWCRAMLDYQRPAVSGRLLIVDYKTCEAADRAAIARAVLNHGYHQQAPFYVDGAVTLGLDEAPGFVFVFQEKTPPHLVTVITLDDDAMAAGRRRNARAREIFRDCTASGIWPEHTTDIEEIALPRYALRDLEGDL